MSSEGNVTDELSGSHIEAGKKLILNSLFGCGAS